MIPRTGIGVLAVTALLAIGLRAASAAPAVVTSIHQEQDAQHAAYSDAPETFFDAHRPATAAHRALRAHGGLRTRVMGWHPYWMGTAYTDYDFSLLSTVAYFSYGVNPADGNPTTTRSWMTTDLVPYAQARGVKVVLTVTLFGSSDNRTFLNNATARENLISQLIYYVQARGGDGVNIDFEDTPGDVRDQMTAFISSLCTRMRAAIPGAEISVALPAVDWNNAFDVAAYNSHVDFCVLMGYNYHYSGSPYPGPVGTLYISPGHNWWLSIQDSVNRYLNKGIQRDKFVVGVPYYGLDWPTTSHALDATTTGSGTARTYADAKGYVSQYGRHWENDTKTPYVLYGSYRQLWYDDAESLGHKCDYLLAENLGGLGIWALGYDGTAPELWDMIETKLTLSDPCAGTDDAEPAGAVAPTNGATFFPGAAFTSTWRVANAGGSTWSRACGQVWVRSGGDSFGAGDRVELGASASVAPGQTAVFSLPMTAPQATGTYSASWSMRRGDTAFGDAQTLSIRVVPNWGSLRVDASPPEAVAAGLRWRREGSAVWYACGALETNVALGTHALVFEPHPDWDPPTGLTATVSGGQLATVTAAFTRATGSLRVECLPSGAASAGARWRAGEGTWRTSGETESGLPTGPWAVSFDELAAWLPPPARTASIARGSTTSITGSYVRKTGAVQVTLQPPVGGWRLLGETAWRASGTVANDVPTGNCEVEVEDTPDWLTPGSVSASVAYAQTTVLTAAYTRKSGVLCADALPAEVQADAVWRIDGGAARAPGDCAGAATGSREVTFDWVNGWQSPPPQTVALAWGATSSCTGVYTRTNHPPVLDLPARWTVRAGVTFGAVFHALDPESNACLVTTMEKPSGSIVADTGDGHAFYWPSPPGVAGATQWLAVVACDDGGLCSTARCALVIGTPPHWDGPTACTALMGRTTRVCVTLNDPDADTPAVELEAPAYVALLVSGGVHCLDIAPPLLSAGTVAVARLSAVDPDGPAEHLLHVHVRGLPRLELTPFREVARGASVMELVNAWDPDGESLALAVGPLPDGASFTGGGASGLLRYVAAQGATDALHVVVFTTSDSDGAVTGRIVFCVGEPADDGDADGLPDAWEWRNFDGPVQCEPDDDLDGDGHTARAEWVAGTDPNASTSIFQVGLGAVSNGAVSELHWPSVSGRLYRILRSDTLGVEAWSPMTNQQATPPLNRWSLPTNLPKGYFLIEVERNPAP